MINPSLKMCTFSLIEISDATLFRGRFVTETPRNREVTLFGPLQNAKVETLESVPQIISSVTLFRGILLPKHL